MPTGPWIVAALLGALIGLGAPRLARRVAATLPPVVEAPPVVGARPPVPGVAVSAAGAVVTADGGAGSSRGAADPAPGAASPAPGAASPALGDALPMPGGAGTAVAGGVVFGGLTAALGVDPALPVFLALAAVGLVLALVDLACLRLPDPLVGAAALVAGVGLTGVALVAGTPGRLLDALLGAIVAGGTHVVLALLPRSRLGFGDVKLAAVLGLPLGWLGWPALWLGLLLPHLLQGLLVLVLLATHRARRDTALPLGPALLTGTWLTTLLP